MTRLIIQDIFAFISISMFTIASCYIAAGVTGAGQ